MARNNCETRDFFFFFFFLPVKIVLFSYNKIYILHLLKEYTTPSNFAEVKTLFVQKL